MTEASAIQNIRQLDLARKVSARSFRWIVLLSAAHMLLGVLLYTRTPLALLHPAAVLCVGMYWALNTRYRIERAGLAIAYLVGVEVLWRMAHVPVFWEFGKYGAAVIAIAALLRRGHFRIPALPLLYIALLLPGCVLTLIQEDLVTARTNLSSIMSGPMLLVVSCWYFSAVKVRVHQLRQLFFTIIIPLFGVAFAAAFFTITTEEIQFTNESNFVTSGGFGPNQVSAMLGLGALLAFACLLIFKNAPKYIVYLLAAGLFFTAQSVLTFSRGGIYNAAGALIVIAVIELRRPTVFFRRFAPLAAVLLVGLLVIFPVLNQFTGGSLLERFEDTATTSRAEIAESDIAIFAENPVLGVGVGTSTTYRKKFFDHEAPNHTEFSRLLAEHGIFGLFALVTLVGMSIWNFVGQRSVLGRAAISGALIWASLFMLNAGMRLAAPSFIWGFSFISIQVPVLNRLRPRSLRSRSTIAA